MQNYLGCINDSRNEVKFSKMMIEHCLHLKLSCVIILMYFFKMTNSLILLLINK